MKEEENQSDQEKERKRGPPPLQQVEDKGKKKRISFQGSSKGDIFSLHLKGIRSEEESTKRISMLRSRIQLPEKKASLQKKRTSEADVWKGNLRQMKKS